MIGQIPARCRSATSFEPASNQIAEWNLAFTLTLNVYQACDGVGRCSKMGVVLRQARNKTSGLLLGYFTISTCRGWQCLIARYRSGALWTQRSPIATAWNSELPSSWCSPSRAQSLTPITTRFWESYAATWLWVVSQQGWHSSSDWLKSSNAVMQHLSEKMIDIFMFLKHKLYRWGGKMKHLIVYFLTNIYAKNYQNRLMYVNVVAIAVELLPR